ncbi:MAG: 50S ribosomal protein L21 [Deltaproteobacteria bacterium]|nr:50S ribosomal protein L21 [Deltaproteobacteria bacterium]
MYAVIKTGGKQYRVAEGDEIRVEKLPGEVGDAVMFDQVLLTSDGEAVEVGQPFLESSKVAGHIIGHGKNRKVLILKYKRRKGYRRKNGHRQHFSLVRIGGIESGIQN